MIDSIIQDSTQIVNQTVSNSVQTNQSLNWWMWLAVAEFCIILLLLLRNRAKWGKTDKQKFKEESLNQEIDFKNIINSSFHSISLYDELKDIKNKKI